MSEKASWQDLLDALKGFYSNQAASEAAAESAVAAAEALTAAYVKYASRATSGRTTAAPGLATASFEARKFGQELSEQLKRNDGGTSIATIEADFCHASCHASHKGRSRR